MSKISLDDQKKNFVNLQKCYEEYKAVNETNESKNDYLVNDKLSKLNSSINQYQDIIEEKIKFHQRPNVEIAKSEKINNAYFSNFIRYGEGNLSEFEKKSLSSETGVDGGFLAPSETEATILSAVKSVSPMRQIATVQQISTGTYQKPVSSAGTSAGWVEETIERTQTTASQISARQFPTMELFAMPAATQTLLDDSIVDIEQWLAGEVQHEFASKEGEAFVSGNGTNAPKGFLSYVNKAEGTQGTDELGFLKTKSDGALGDAPLDTLLDLVYAPGQVYRSNGRFVMNRNTLSTLRKIRDGEGNYVWQPSTQFGQPSTLLGYPVTELEDMPDVASNSFPIAFGDFQRGYLIVDRTGVRLLRDPYTAKPYVLFYVTKRVGGGVLDFKAIKLLKASA